MTDKTPSQSKTPSQTPTYISSSGHTLESLPLTARINRITDSLYNFFGLYLVSLLSLDPYTAAQNSRFNTRGPGRQANAAAGSAGPRTGGGGGLFGGGRLGGGSGGSAGPQGGGGGGGRRMGTVNDVRGPECGSCG